MRKVFHGLLVVGMAGMALVLSTGRASAEPCASFTVSVSPPIVQEGGKSAVTVTRRGSLGNSSVDLNTESVSALSGRDFEPLDLTVHFAEDITSRSFQVKIIDDDDREGEERFRVHLSNLQGCEAEDGDLGDDRSITIVASDRSSGSTPAPTATASPAPTTTASSTSSPSASASPSPSVSPSPSPSTSPTPTPSPVITLDPSREAGDDDDEGISSLGIAGIIIGGLAAGAAVTSLFWWRRRY